MNISAERTKPLTKPKFRGVSHEIACYGAGFAGPYLVAHTHGARLTEGALAAVVIYSLGIFFLFAVSALYHRPHWSPVARARMRRVDHTTIYLMIAGTATPLAVMGLEGGAQHTALTLIWIGAALGILKSLLWMSSPKPLTAATYVLLGVALLPYLPAFEASFGPVNAALLIAGAVAYVTGALTYALRKPDPWPTVFGYHEIFHALVIIAAGCHFFAILRIIEARA